MADQRPAYDAERRLARIDLRLAALEKDSHPPIDLTPAIREILQDMREGAGNG